MRAYVYFQTNISIESTGICDTKEWRIYLNHIKRRDYPNEAFSRRVISR